jgi:hypothetical protein
MRADFLVAVRTFGKLRHAKRVMRAAIGSPALGMAAFWIRHSFPSLSLVVNCGPSWSRLVARSYLDAKIFQFAPTIIHRVGLTAAILLVAVLAAHGTDAFAGFAADELHWQS